MKSIYFRTKFFGLKFGQSLRGKVEFFLNIFKEGKGTILKENEGRGDRQLGEGKEKAWGTFPYPSLIQN